MDRPSWVRRQLQSGVFMIERLIRKRDNVYEFTDDPNCILRIQLMPSHHAIELGDQRIQQGDPVLVIHVWNERMPCIPSGGADLKWALHLRRQVINSFKLLGNEVSSNHRYDSVTALYGDSILFSTTGHTGGTQMMKSLGFTILPFHHRLGSFGIFWENLFSWWLMWAFNQPSQDSRKFWQLERTEIWMARQEFLRRYTKMTQTT